MSAKAIQICGTGSGVGKSVIVAGLCRVFLKDGFKVAPFKAQNMSLNSFVTSDSGEIGRAQAMQAAACCLEPSVDMNPILLKPTSDKGSQVIVRGRPVGNMSVFQYKDYKKKAGLEVRKSFKSLQEKFSLIVIEGAGSPAEINLKADDIVNMKMAQAAKAPVILVGDIDKGGVFAWLIGTLMLLTKNERKMVKGFIINKFRGDKRLLTPGIKFLEKKTGIEVLGVVPYFKDIRIPEEDSAALESKKPAKSGTAAVIGLLDIAVIQLPRISNFTDFEPLAREPDVRLRYVCAKEDLNSADLIIIPGTKSTVSDLAWLRRSGIADKLISMVKSQPATMLIGVCGGYQMLGETIIDDNKIESGSGRIEGLGILPVSTCFGKEKILSRVKAREPRSGSEIIGYEIHHGRTGTLKGLLPAFKIFERQGKSSDEFDGAASEDRRILGTYIHGLFDADLFRRSFLNRLRLKKGLSPLPGKINFDLDNELDKLAILLRENIDMGRLYRILDNGV